VKGEFYSQNTVDTVLVPNPAMRCDDIVILTIVFEPIPGRTINPSGLCVGETFTYAGVDYTTDQNTVVTVPGPTSCDSMNELILNFQPLESINLTIDTLCQGTSFDFRGTSYTQTEIVNLTFPGMNGECDTSATLDLTFNPVPERTVAPSDLCEGDIFPFDGFDYMRDTIATVFVDDPGGVCDSMITLNLTFSPVIMTAITETLCEGETFTIDNMDFTESIITDVRVPDLNGGCDSIFNLDITFTPLIRTTLSPDLCEGDGFSYTANGNTYAEGQLLSGTERVLGPNGCDSVITVDLFFKPNSETRIEEIRNSGDGFSQVINGTTYDESNPIDTITLSSANGCDSVIFVNLAFLTGVFDSLIIDNECAGSGFSVPGGPSGPFDESNPSGIDTFLLADGRDSFFITRITFQDPAINRFTNTLTTGDPFSITFNGVTYDSSNPMGRDTLAGAAANGCDSIIIVSLTFTDAFTSVIDSMFCEGDPFSVVVFREPDTTMISPSRCIGDGFSVTVGPDTYDEANPSGTTPLMNAIGCDSIVIVDLQFSNGVTTNFTDVICSGTTVTIGSTVYGEDTQLTGTEVLMANGGCDSTVIVMLTVDTVHFELITTPICPGEEEFEFMIINTRPGQDLTAVIDGSPRVVTDTLRETLPVGSQDIVIANDRGCGAMPPFDLSFHPTETLDIIETAGAQDTLTLTYDFTGIETMVVWTTGSTELCVDCTSVNVSSSESATYEVEIIDELGCTYRDTFEVIGEDLPPPPPMRDTMDFFLPNVISSFAASQNTSLYLQTVNTAIIDYDLRIYNRWGNLVRTLSNLTPNDPTFGWDGRSSTGDLQPIGVYVYVVVIRREGGTEQTEAGDLLLME